jgi:hypothetical protein
VLSAKSEAILTTLPTCAENTAELAAPDRSPLTYQAIVDVAARRPSSITLAAADLYQYFREPFGAVSRRYESPVHPAPGSPIGREHAFVGWRCSTREGWIYLHNEDSKAGQADPANRYKMYVSPHQADLPAVARLTAPVLRKFSVKVWKVAANYAHALRPDKLVIYFPGRLDIALISELRSLLAHFEEHGVPLAGQVAGTGLLYFGRDPVKGRSWRAEAARLLAPATMASDPLAAATRIIRATPALSEILASPAEAADSRPRVLSVVPC